MYKCVTVFPEDGVEAELDGAEEGGVKTEADDEETRKLLQKDLVVDRFTRAELHYRKVVCDTNCEVS